jgi:ATP-binding cassette, subfamily B, bacterial MsbA
MGLSTLEIKGYWRVGRVIAGRWALFALTVAVFFLSAILEGGSIVSIGAAIDLAVDPGASTELSALAEQVGEISVIKSLKSTIGTAGLLVVFAILGQIGRAGFSMLGAISSAYLAAAVQLDIGGQTTKHVMSFDFQTASKFGSGQLASAVEQTKVGAILARQLAKLVYIIAMLSVYLVILARTSTTSGVLIVVGIGVVWVLSSKASALVGRLGKLEANKELRLWQRMVQYVNAPAFIRIFDKVDQVVKEINESREAQVITRRRSQVIQSMIPPLFDVAIGILLLLAIVVIAPGEIVSISVVANSAIFLIIAIRIKPQILALNGIRLRLSNISGKLGVLEGILGKPTSSSDGLGKCEKVRSNWAEIRFDKVSLSYVGASSESLSEVSFRIKRNSFTALVGRSGSGKTSVIRLLARLIEPTSGRIFIGMGDLHDLCPKDWKAKLGVVEQDPMFFRGTIRENLDFVAPQKSEEQIETALKEVGAIGFVKALKKGIDTRIEEGGVSLSGGQLQRVALARAILRRPDVLVLDEATSGLDWETASIVYEFLKRKKGKITILAIAHTPELIELADNVIRLDAGRLIAMDEKTG